MSYYTLIPARMAQPGKPVPEPDDGELSAWTSPRAIAIGDTVAEVWNERDEITYLLHGHMALVQVAPIGTVETAYIDGGSEMLASTGWTVEAVLSLDELLGPQARAIREVTATEMSLDDESDYDDELTALQQHPEMDEVHEDMASPDELVERAVAALNAADIDGDWWSDQVGCTRGYELVALAARDLVDTTDGWCVHGFTQLMRPWTEVKGEPAHEPARS